MSFSIRFCFACSISVRGTSVQFLAFLSILFHCNHPPINTFIKKKFCPGSWAIASLLVQPVIWSLCCTLQILGFFCPELQRPNYVSPEMSPITAAMLRSAGHCQAWAFKRDACLEFRHVTAIMFLLLYMDYVIEFAQLPYDIKNYCLRFQKRNLSPRAVR